MGVCGWGWMKGNMSQVSKQCFFANKNMFKANNEPDFISGRLQQNSFTN